MIGLEDTNSIVDFYRCRSSHGNSHLCFIIVINLSFMFFCDDALIELGMHHARRTFDVFCITNFIVAQGKDLSTVYFNPTPAPRWFLCIALFLDVMFSSVLYCDTLAWERESWSILFYIRAFCLFILDALFSISFLFLMVSTVGYVF